MRRFNIKRAYTLVEILIAVSLFATVGMISITIFINITRIQTQLALENAIYEDARFMMERISRSIRNNAIDYEEYFNKSISTANLYGELFGCYAAQFYNPGTTKPGNLTINPGDLGAHCNDTTFYTGQSCVVYKPSIDLNTGKYPYLGAPLLLGLPPANSNAFCPAYPPAFGAPACTPSNDNMVHELYLINADGTTKTIFALKKVHTSPDEFALAMVEKDGEDANHDGITEKWNGCTGNTYCCDPDYDCNSSGDTLEQSLASGAAADIYKGFVPISPLRTTVTRLDLLVTPGEDPRKAFAEIDVVMQPRVVITLEVEPTAAQVALVGYPAGVPAPSIVLQTTVSSRIQSEVKSYLGPGANGLTANSGVVCQLSGT